MSATGAGDAITTAEGAENVENSMPEVAAPSIGAAALHPGGGGGVALPNPGVGAVTDRLNSPNSVFAWFFPSLPNRLPDGRVVPVASQYPIVAGVAASNPDVGAAAALNPGGGGGVAALNPGVGGGVAAPNPGPGRLYAMILAPSDVTRVLELPVNFGDYLFNDRGGPAFITTRMSLVENSPPIVFEVRYRAYKHRAYITRATWNAFATDHGLEGGDEISFEEHGDTFLLTAHRNGVALW